MKKLWGIYWSLISILGIRTLVQTLRLSSESRNALLWGLSKNKLAMSAGILFLTLFCAVLAVRSFKSNLSAQRTGKAAGILSAAGIYLFILGTILLNPPVGRTALERALKDRLLDFGIWLLAASLLGLLFKLIQHHAEIYQTIRNCRRSLFAGILALVISFAALLFAIHTQIGIQPISGTFYRQGVSLLEGHLVVPLLLLYLFLPVYLIITNPSKACPSKTRETFQTAVRIALPLLIWASAVYFWQTTVFEGRSYFAPALRAPNYNFYPASDAENYDLIAQSILIGNGFRCGLTIVRPLYTAFLALLHALFGNDYLRITNAQILVLALFPVCVYEIAAALKHRPAGILAAAWLIWREVYSIQVTPLVQVSNSRLLMSDYPTALLVSIVVLCGLRIVRQSSRDKNSLLCGGMIGLSMLLRTQCVVLLGAAGLLLLITEKQFRSFCRRLLLCVLGVILVFGPWTLYGKLSLNQYVHGNNSEGQYLVKLYRTAVGSDDLKASLPELILSHPIESMQAVAAHFLNNEISSLLVLPVRLTAPNEAEELFKDTSLFWYRENALETLQSNLPLILLYLTVLAAGIASARNRAGIPGLFPLFIHLIYNLGSALALNSGFRFILPVDWVPYFYFAIGCESILNGFFQILLREKLSQNQFIPVEEKISIRPVRSLLPAALLLLLTGCILPACDFAIPYRFESQPSQSLTQDGTVTLSGRLIYPRFYKAGEGDSGGSSSAKRGLDSDRMVWVLVNREINVLSLPLEPNDPAAAASLPDPYDAVITGIPREDYIEVLDIRPLTAESEH